jgi:hypothetical protein
VRIKASIRFGFIAWLIAGFGCSSSSSRVLGEACGAGESVSCLMQSGCQAAKVCNADGKGYGPCLCVPDAGDAGTGGKGGSGGGGSGGVGGADASSGGMSGASGAGAGGTGGASDGSASDGSGGDAAGFDSGICLKCLEALDRAVLPNDPRICQASRAPHANLYNCVCATGGPCESQCLQHCINPNTGFPGQCQSCATANCGNLAVDCQMH